MSLDPPFADRGRTESSVSTAPPLSALVSASTADHLGTQDVYRRYTASVVSKTKLQSSTSVAATQILYEVGPRFVGDVDWKTALSSLPEPEKRIHQVIATNDVVKAELTDRHKKFTNFSGRFDYTDLSAVAKVLAKGLAKFTLTGTLTAAELLGGAAVSVRSLNARADPVGAGEGCVFIPRSTAVDASPGAFTALTCAVCNAGGSVFTDMVEVDENNRSVLNAPSDAHLAMGCVYGMRILLSMYDDMGAGPTIAYAIVAGVHNILSVVGHTDEGGLIRDALRAADFARPFGGIYTSEVRNFVGLPMPDATSLPSFQSLVDSIAIGSAGCVALADPTVEYEGRRYPTVYTYRGSIFEEPGMEAKSAITTRTDLASQIANGSAAFATNFIGLLGKLFCLKGDGDVAVDHIQLGLQFIADSCRESLAGGKKYMNRHLDMVSLAPYFWVEPTSLFSAGFCTTEAAASGFGPVAHYDKVAVDGLFEQTRLVGVNGPTYDVIVSWRSARTNALIRHLNMSKDDGLANLVPKQFSSARFHMTSVNDGVAALRSNGADVKAYMWGRGQSPFPAPAEMIYLGQGIGCGAVNLRVSPTDIFEVQRTHFPAPLDLENSTVTVSVGRPVSIGIGKMMQFTRPVSRCRTQASRALQRARDYVSGTWVSGSCTMEAGEIEPALTTTIRSAFDQESAVEVLRGPPAVGGSTRITSEPMARVLVDGTARPRSAGRPLATPETVIVPADLTGRNATALATAMEAAHGIPVTPEEGRDRSLPVGEGEPAPPASE